MDKLTEILEKGIQAKRTGNYKLALEYYDKAREISPIDKRIFGNIFRIYIGLERYEDALRNLLIMCNNNRVDRLIDQEMQDPMAKVMRNDFHSKFKSTTTLYKKGLFRKVTYEPELIQTALQRDELLNDLIFRADNLTYYIGHSFIGLHPSIRSTHNIPEKEFNNLNNALLGKPTGNDLREHKSAGLFLCIGFIFAHMNLKEGLTTKESIVSYYLNTLNKLNFDIPSYREYMTKNKNTASKPQHSSSSIETFLGQITMKVRKELGCECFYEFKSIDDYISDMALRLHLPILLMEMDLKIDNVINQNYHICTIAIEIDEDCNVVSKRSDIHMNDRDVQHTLEEMLNTVVTLIGRKTRNERRFRTLKFLIQA